MVIDSSYNDRESTSIGSYKSLYLIRIKNYKIQDTTRTTLKFFF